MLWFSCCLDREGLAPPVRLRNDMAWRALTLLPRCYSTSRAKIGVPSPNSARTAVQCSSYHCVQSEAEIYTDVISCVYFEQKGSGDGFWFSMLAGLEECLRLFAAWGRSFSRDWNAPRRLHVFWCPKRALGHKTQTQKHHETKTETSWNIWNAKGRKSPPFLTSTCNSRN